MAAIGSNKFHVEIGVVEECDSYLLESRYFPSKVGGKPAWLDLKELPSDLTCGTCNRQCIFLCQVYAPIDDHPTAHHRTIFLFVCPEPTCCKPNNNKNFKVLRCQLPAKNNFYPIQDPTEDESWHPECKVENFSKICCLCGNPAPFNCGKCKVTSYCSKEHQVSHWKLYGHKISCSSDVKEVRIESPFLFPELEIIIDTPLEEIQLAKTEEEALSDYNELLESGGTGSLEVDTAELSLMEQSAIKEDKYFFKYQQSIKRCPEQVLRYDKGGSPLYIAKPDFEPNDVPSCEYCGGQRQFEFQILSTLLNEVSTSSLLNNLDWGTLLIYTCSNSCSQGPAYKAEYVYKQDVTA